jgi:DNA topoisomerase-3
MIAERDYKVKNFVKEKYYTVDLLCEKFVACTERIDSFDEAERIRIACTGKSAVVTSVKRVKKGENPPKLYDLTTLQREANRQFSFSAQETLDFVQSLYLKKLATYPRTDSQFLTEDMAGTVVDLIGLVYNKIPLYSGFPYVPNIGRVIDNSLVSDHHAIILTAEIANVNLDDLPDGERKILCLIANKLLCATAAKHEYERITATLECGGFSFTASGKTLINDGWRTFERLFKGKGGDSDTTLDLSEGQVIERTEKLVAEHQTSPPKHFTEDTLLSAMETAGNKDYVEGADVEKKGLGTPATRAATIETLIKRGYIVRNDKSVVATEKGTNFIRIVPIGVKSAKLTADWETILQQIERGQANADTFMSEITAFTKKLVADNSAAADKYADSFKKPQAIRESVGKCPKCGGEVTETPKAFSCGGGRGECKFVLWKNQYGKENALTSAQAKKLLNSRKTDKIKGFVSKKTNKPYDAFLVLKSDYTVGMEFN